MTNLEYLLKSRDFTLPTKAHIVKAMVFPIFMYGCESWTVKKAVCWRIHAFELWCWGKTLESPLDCKEIKPVNPKGNQPWLFTGSTERLKAGGEGDETGRAGWMASPTPWTWVWASSRRWWRTEKPGMLQSMASQRVEHNWATEQQQNCMLFQATPEKDADPELRKSSNFNFAVWPKTSDLNISLTRLPDHQIVLTVESDCKEWMKLCLRSTGKYYENAWNLDIIRKW